MILSILPSLLTITLAQAYMTFREINEGTTHPKVFAVHSCMSECYQNESCTSVVLGKGGSCSFGPVPDLPVLSGAKADCQGPSSSSSKSAYTADTLKEKVLIMNLAEGTRLNRSVLKFLKCIVTCQSDPSCGHVQMKGMTDSDFECSVEEASEGEDFAIEKSQEQCSVAKDEEEDEGQSSSTTTTTAIPPETSTTTSTTSSTDTTTTTAVKSALAGTYYIGSTGPIPVYTGKIHELIPLARSAKAIRMNILGSCSVNFVLTNSTVVVRDNTSGEAGKFKFFPEIYIDGLDSVTAECH